MSSKTLTLTEPLYDYWLAHGLHESDVLKKLREETQKLSTAVMQISPEQGQFMHFLTKLLNVKDALEIGTFTGYSAIAVASALPESGKLICCDQSKEWTDIARKFWKETHLEHKIELRLAPALESLRTLGEEQRSFDLIFIDADKINYMHYYETSMTLLRPTGVLLIDNVFFSGGVADPENQLPATRAIRALNKRLHDEPNIDICILPIGDGLTMVRKTQPA